MVDWHDPNIIAAENFALVKFINVIGGIYIWEFVSYFGFEYSVYRKRRKFTWPFLLYVGCRWCPLFIIVSQFVSFDLGHEIDCQAWVVAFFVLGYLTFIFASALIILRVAVLWDRNKYVTTFSCVVWLGNIGVYAYTSATIRSSWTGRSCTISNTDQTKLNILSTFVTDIILLILMLAGLFRWKNAPKTWGLWRLLRIQGLLWIAIVTLGEVPASVFLLLNLNDPMNLFFQILALIVSTLGATRLYRGLADFPTADASANLGSNAGGWAPGGVVTPGSRSAYTRFRHNVSKQGASQGEGGLVKLENGIPQVTTSGSGVQTVESFEGRVIVLKELTRQ